MALPDEFYVSLSSDENREQFPENNEASFVNLLPNPLFLNQEYCAALTEIYIPSFVIQNTIESKGRETVGSRHSLGAPHPKKKNRFEFKCNSSSI